MDFFDPEDFEVPTAEERTTRLRLIRQAHCCRFCYGTEDLKHIYWDWHVYTAVISRCSSTTGNSYYQPAFICAKCNELVNKWFDLQRRWMAMRQAVSLFVVNGFWVGPPFTVFKCDIHEEEEEGEEEPEDNLQDSYLRDLMHLFDQDSGYEYDFESFDEQEDEIEPAVWRALGVKFDKLPKRRGPFRKSFNKYKSMLYGAIGLISVSSIVWFLGRRLM